jgi:hypothetical protein
MGALEAFSTGRGEQWEEIRGATRDGVKFK